MSSLPCSCVAFSGSRRALPAAALRCASGVVASLAPAVAAAGGSFAVGCCPSGLDLAVRASLAAAGSPCRLFSVAGVRSASALRARSLRLVAACSCLFVFPRSPSFIRSGSWLCAFAAARRGVPVFVFLPGSPASALPCVGGVSAWRAVPGASVAPGLAGFSFFRPVVEAAPVPLL